METTAIKLMDLNPGTGENFMDPDNDGWGWAELLTSPGYTLVYNFSFLIADNC